MTHPFLALTDDDREEMLKTIGVSSIDELFRDIPASMRLDRGLDLEPALSEQELVAHLTELAGRNLDTTRELSFLGQKESAAGPAGQDPPLRGGCCDG